MASLITVDDILAARDRIAPVAVRTPLTLLDPGRLRAAGYTPAASIYLKDESAQPIRSFKLRGAYNMIAQLAERDPAALAAGVITYSSGNHAQGVAYAARSLGLKAVIVMPANTPEIKHLASAALGAEIVLVGPASSERKLLAEQLAATHGYSIIPPYDHPAIIAGQATCGLEILEQIREAQLPAVDLVLSPVSGGGLLSGTATAIKLAAIASIPAVYGCEPALAADAKASFDSGTLTEWPAEHTTRTLADGLRTQALGHLNFAHILRFVDGIVTVTEDEIRTATRILLTTTNIIAEPSGAVTLAAALFHAHQLPPAHSIACIVSGGNLDPALRTELLTVTV